MWGDEKGAADETAAAAEEAVPPDASLVTNVEKSAAAAAVTGDDVGSSSSSSSDGTMLPALVDSSKNDTSSTGHPGAFLLLHRDPHAATNSNSRIHIPRPCFRNRVTFPHSAGKRAWPFPAEALLALLQLLLHVEAELRSCCNIIAPLPETSDSS